MWLASTAYTIASLVFPTRFPDADLTNTYLVTLAVRIPLENADVNSPTVSSSLGRANSATGTPHISRKLSRTMHVQLSNQLLKVFCSLSPTI